MSGVYSVSLSEAELEAYTTGVAESIPKNAPASDFADPPKGLYVGDAAHVGYAVQAVTQGFRGNKATNRSKPGVKGRVASAIRKFYTGDERAYYLKWLNTGKKPDEKPAAETKVMHEMYITAPRWNAEDEPKFPDVPINPNINLDKLIQRNNDTSPKFVVRPLAILGEVSENGLPYNQAIFDGVYQRISAGPIPARMGHVSQADKSSLFPPDQGYWVGVVMDDTVFGKPTLFGKCYLLPGHELRETVLDREAIGVPISNSLWGDVTTVDNEPDSIALETIDFVPEERAALQALGGEFVVTSEMKKGVSEMADEKGDVLELLKAGINTIEPIGIHEMLHEMGKAHGVAEAHMKAHEMGHCSEGTVPNMLSAGHLKSVAEAHLKEAAPQAIYEMLSEEARKHIAETHLKEGGMKAVPHEASVVHEGAMAEMKASSDKALAEMEKRIKVYERRDFERALDAAIDAKFAGFHEPATPKGIEGLAALKKNLRRQSLAEMAGMENGQVEENIASSVEKAYPEVKPLIEMYIAGVSGPAAVSGPSGEQAQTARNGWDPKTGRYTDDFVNYATTQTGVLGGRSNRTARPAAGGGN